MKKINIKDIKTIIKNNKQTKVAIVSHSISDMDFMASAISLSEYLSNSKIVIPDKINQKVINILAEFKIVYAVTNKLSDYDLIIMLDVNHFDTCGKLSDELIKTTKDIVIIDHHVPNRIDKNNVYVFDSEEYTSTSNIMYQILTDLKVDLTPMMAKLLLAGIISDSAELRNSNSQTFCDISRLLKISKTSYTTILSKISYNFKTKERYKILEDISNSNKLMINGILLLYGKSKTPAHITADIAIRSGADAAIFYSIYQKEISFSTRLLHPIDTKYKIHLGLIMKNLSQIINGSGGGHPCAGGAYGSKKENYEIFINEFIDIIKNKTSRVH